MTMLFMEAIGPEGERLALAAAERIGVPVGWDADLASATFDSDEHADEASLREAVFAALAELDSDWASQLREAE